MTNEGVVPVSNEKSNNMSRAIDLYYFPASPPCRSVMLLARALGINLNLKLVNIMEGEQMKKDYLKINPQHCVPTINDNGFVLWESRAILTYFCNIYDKDNIFLPTDPQQAAVVNQRLYFDAFTLTPSVIEYFTPVVAGAEPNQKSVQKIEEALGFLNSFLEGEVWLAGRRMTIAEFAIVAPVATAEAVQIDVDKYPNVSAWYQRTKRAMKAYGYDEINQKGADMIGGRFRAKLKNSIIN